MIKRSLKKHSFAKKMTIKNGVIKKRSGKKKTSKKSLYGGYTYGTSRNKDNVRRRRTTASNKSHSKYSRM